LDGPTPPLTAADALDLDDIASIVSDLTGRTIKRVVADDAEFVAGMVGAGVPQARADMMLGMFLASRNGEFSATDSALADILGRPATTLRAYLGEVLATD